MDARGDHLGAEGRDRQLATAGLARVVDVKPLVFNANNSATGVVELLHLADGSEVVRKVLRSDAEVVVPHWAAGSSGEHWNYWRREADAYLSRSSRSGSGQDRTHQTGSQQVAPDERRADQIRADQTHSDEASSRRRAPAAAPQDSIIPSDGVRAPRLLARVAPSPGVEVLFLEHVAGRSGPELDADDLAAVARGLGRWQGRRAAGTIEQLHGVRHWWSRDWMWRYARSRPVRSADYEDTGAWANPLVREGFGDSLERIRSGFGVLHGELDRWAKVAAGLPVAPAHQDTWANNVVLPSGGGGEVVLLDWSFCGAAHVGADAGNLVPDGLLDHYGEPGSYAASDRLVTYSYLSGLADGGWAGSGRRESEDLVRLGMCLAPVKFAWLPAHMVANADWTGPTGYGGQEGIDHLSVFRRRAIVFEAMLDQIDEARSLAARHGLWN